MSQILITLSAIILQFIYSHFSLRQIRTEELSESVRSVYWFGERLVYEGLSTHLGWYAPLLLIYKIFGFQIDYAKWYRFGLWAVAVICLASLLKKYLGRYWWLVFFTITTSPTLLYFNQLSTHYGVDVSFLIICLWLLSKLQNSPQDTSLHRSVIPAQAGIYSAILWFTAMWAWLSYPTFVYYLPAFAFLFYKATSCHTHDNVIHPVLKALPCSPPAGGAREGLITPSSTSRSRLILIIVGSISFLLPLILGIAYIQNRHLLIFDSQDHAGLFRGAGKLEPDFTHAVLRVGESFKSFFVTTPNYYYEITWPEFGSAAPVVLVLMMIGVLVLLSGHLIYTGHTQFILRAISEKSDNSSLRQLADRTILFYVSPIFIKIILSILFLNLISLALFADTGGTWASIRRTTGLLVVIYALVIIGFKKLINSGKWGKSVAVISCSILLLYHIFAYYFNWLSLQKPSVHQEQSWFVSAPNPQTALDNYLQAIQKQDIQVRCTFIESKASDCSYSRIYAAVMGSCTWNRLNCHRLWGWDPVLTGYLPMNLSRWDSQWSWDKADAKF